MPLLTLMLIVVVDGLISEPLAHSHRLHTMRHFVIAGLSVFITVLGLSTMVSLISGAALRTFVAPHRPRFDAPALTQFVPVGDDILYTRWVNDGFALLKAYRRPGEHVMSLDFTNPFTFGLHLPPAAGGTSNLQYRGSFDDRFKLSSERLYGASELVMVPVNFSDYSLQTSLLRIYGPYLRQHYRLVGHSDEWNLYRRLP